MPKCQNPGRMLPLRKTPISVLANVSFTRTRNSPSPVTRPLILSITYSRKIMMNEESKTFHICHTSSISGLPLFSGQRQTLARYTVTNDIVSSGAIVWQLWRDSLSHPCSREAVYSSKVNATAKMMKSISDAVTRRDSASVSHSRIH